MTFRTKKKRKNRILISQNDFLIGSEKRESANDKRPRKNVTLKSQLKRLSQRQ
jgi:hypothetical protein